VGGIIPLRRARSSRFGGRLQSESALNLSQKPLFDRFEWSLSGLKGFLLVARVRKPPHICRSQKATLSLQTNNHASFQIILMSMLVALIKEI
jgi:hypothetical protein